MAAVSAAISGFTTIWLIVAVGWVLAHVGLVTANRQRFMNNLAFLVAGPALMFSLLRETPLDDLFSRTLLASVAAVGVAGGVYLLLHRRWFRTGRGPGVIGFMASCYTNAGNIGLPLTALLLGGMGWMPPIILLQVALIQPVCLALLDADRVRRDGGTLSPGRYVMMPLRNPLTVGILLGVAANLTGVTVPGALATPIAMVGDMMVPLMILAFGASLRLNPLPGKGPHRTEAWVIQVIKIVVHPLAAYLLARHALGLAPHDVYAVTVIAALPCAQNVFTIANRYGTAELLARDSVFWSTLFTVPSILAITALVGA